MRNTATICAPARRTVFAVVMMAALGCGGSTLGDGPVDDGSVDDGSVDDGPGASSSATGGADALGGSSADTDCDGATAGRCGGSDADGTTSANDTTAGPACVGRAPECVDFDGEGCSDLLLPAPCEDGRFACPAGTIDVAQCVCFNLVPKPVCVDARDGECTDILVPPVCQGVPGDGEWTCDEGSVEIETCGSGSSGSGSGSGGSTTSAG